MCIARAWLPISSILWIRLQTSFCSSSGTWHGESTTGLAANTQTCGSTPWLHWIGPQWEWPCGSHWKLQSNWLLPWGWEWGSPRFSDEWWRWCCHRNLLIMLLHQQRCSYVLDGSYLCMISAILAMNRDNCHGDIFCATMVPWEWGAKPGFKQDWRKSLQFSVLDRSECLCCMRGEHALKWGRTVQLENIWSEAWTAEYDLFQC